MNYKLQLLWQLSDEEDLQPQEIARYIKAATTQVQQAEWEATQYFKTIQEEETKLKAIREQFYTIEEEKESWQQLINKLRSMKEQTENEEMK